MFTKACAMVVFLFLASPAMADTMDACNLLSPEDLTQLQVPNGAAASPGWSEKDHMYSCKYTAGDSFRMALGFGKPPPELIRNVEGMMEQAKKAPPKDARPGTDGAFNDSAFCVTVVAPEAQISNCTGIRGGTLLSVVIMRSSSMEPMKVPASSLLRTFDGIFSKLTL